MDSLLLTITATIKICNNDKLKKMNLICIVSYVIKLTYIFQIIFLTHTISTPLYIIFTFKLYWSNKKLILHQKYEIDFHNNICFVKTDLNI